MSTQTLVKQVLVVSDTHMSARLDNALANIRSKDGTIGNYQITPITEEQWFGKGDALIENIYGGVPNKARPVFGTIGSEELFANKRAHEIFDAVCIAQEHLFGAKYPYFMRLYLVRANCSIQFSYETLVTTHPQLLAPKHVITPNGLELP